MYIKQSPEWQKYISEREIMYIKQCISYTTHRGQNYSMASLLGMKL